ncbi:MAG: pyridoxal phosphate-dependent aminotransferase [Spirochaetales bacterium]|nr:pyridoxal phosphate-dependent aminotransferase [Spirochaetales bacterium]
MAVSSKIKEMQSSSSFIRKMFETGARLKAEFGAENVFDFSLGNPDLLPPEEVSRVLIEEAARRDWHGYMPNAGYPGARSAVAGYLREEQGVDFQMDHILMTSGAGGALNVALKTLLNPGDKVLVARPCFVEYRFYCDNHGGELVIVDSKDNFDLSIAAFEEAIDEKTAAIIINSPNNPTGKIYPESTLRELADLLERKYRETGRRIYIITDEPYRKIAYDAVVPSLMKIYPHTLLCTSYSKDLSLPGERIGYLAIGPECEDVKDVISGATLCNRILGYVNANALMQRTIARLQGLSVDIGVYRKRRDLLYRGLKDAGFEVTLPEGAFYLFPKAPGGDDMKTVDVLQEENILAVPGRGFALPGYFRLTYCVGEDTITRSLPGFKRAAEKLL